MIGFLIAPVIFVLLIALFVNNNKNFIHNNKLVCKTFSVISFIILLVLPLNIVIGYLLPIGKSKRMFTIIGNYALGVLLYLTIAIVICVFVKIILKTFFKETYLNEKHFFKNIFNIFIIVFTLSLSIYGISNAHDLKITHYEIKTNKNTAVKSLNIVLISDLHLGYNVGCKQISDMANKINDLNPDILVLTGDIFDNEWESLDDPNELVKILSSIKTKYGKFAVYGNHDVEEKVFCGFTFSWNKDKSDIVSCDEMNNFIKESGFVLLYDEYVEIKQNESTVAYIYGRPDYEKPNLNNNQRTDVENILENIDLDKYIICLDHEPRQLDELSKVGVDLTLNGHTHNGQMWPGTLTIKLFWDNAYGLKYFDNMANVVTSGVGLFGPKMRTGCKAEIVQINVEFN